MYIRCNRCGREFEVESDSDLEIPEVCVCIGEDCVDYTIISKEEFEE